MATWATSEHVNANKTCIFGRRLGNLSNPAESGPTCLSINLNKLSHLHKWTTFSTFRPMSQISYRQVVSPWLIHMHRLIGQTLRFAKNLRPNTTPCRSGSSRPNAYLLDDPSLRTRGKEAKLSCKVDTAFVNGWWLYLTQSTQDMGQGRTEMTNKSISHAKSKALLVAAL